MDASQRKKALESESSHVHRQNRTVESTSSAPNVRSIAVTDMVFNSKRTYAGPDASTSER